MHAQLLVAEKGASRVGVRTLDNRKQGVQSQDVGLETGGTTENEDGWKIPVVRRVASSCGHRLSSFRLTQEEPQERRRQEGTKAVIEE